MTIDTAGSVPRVTAEEAETAAVESASMSARRKAAVALCILINAVDGFDVQVVAFTAPAIDAQWQLRPERLESSSVRGLSAWR